MKQYYIAGMIGIGLLVASAQAGDLDLELLATKQRLVLGESLTLQLIVSNRTATAFEQRHDSTRLAGVFAVWVSADGKEFQKHTSHGYVVGAKVQEVPVGVPYPPPVFKLAAGASRRITFPMLFSATDLFGTALPLRHYVFPRPGTYYLRCEMNGESSNTIQVAVEEPKESDQEAWRKLCDVPAYPAVLIHPDHYNLDAETLLSFQKSASKGEALDPDVQAWLDSPKQVDRLALIIDQHPSSIYSHRLSFALGVHYSGPRGDLTNDERLRRAKKYLKMATEMQQVPELREPAWWEWVQVEDNDEARADLCRQSLQAFPNGALRDKFIDAYAWAAGRRAYGGPRFEEEVEKPTLAECKEKNLSKKDCEDLMIQRKWAWLRQNFNPLGDTIPPVITLLGANPVTLECGGAYADAGATATDNKDGDITARIVVENNVDTPKVGTYQVIYRVSDAAGNAATATRTVKVVYKFDGFLAPAGGADATGGNYDKPVKTFKLGSTIPVKFQISCGGTAVKAGVHTLQVIKYNNATTAAEPIDATPTDAATTGNQFKLVGDEWHFNLDTKATGMSTGTWQLKATLSDGSTHLVWIALK